MHSILIYLSGALLSLNGVHAHMRLLEPTRFGGDETSGTGSLPDPLDKSRWPCGKPAGVDDTDFYVWSNATVVAQGENKNLTFECSLKDGCAVHGGGSCQLSLTTDKVPTAKSNWTVFKSFEGGCVSFDGTPYDDPKDKFSYPDTQNYAIPDAFPPGDYTLAWSWIPKFSGMSEFYMNCAPITLTAGTNTSNSSAAQHVSRDDLPEMLVLNLPGVTDCQNGPNMNLLFPDPGPNVAREGSDGDGCSKQLFAYPSLGSGCPQPPSPYSWCGNSTGQLQPEKVHTSSYSQRTGTTGSTTSTMAPSVTAMVTSDLGPPVSVPSSGSGFKVDSTSQASKPAITDTPLQNTNSSGVLGGPCDTEGLWNCIDGKSFQRCSSGQWSVAQSLGALYCTPGTSKTLWRKDNEESTLQRRFKGGPRTL